jgi:hypothetical protein
MISYTLKWSFLLCFSLRLICSVNRSHEQSLSACHSFLVYFPNVRQGKPRWFSHEDPLYYNACGSARYSNSLNVFNTTRSEVSMRRPKVSANQLCIIRLMILPAYIKRNKNIHNIARKRTWYWGVQRDCDTHLVVLNASSYWESRFLISDFCLRARRRGER